MSNGPVAAMTGGAVEGGTAAGETTATTLTSAVAVGRGRGRGANMSISALMANGDDGPQAAQAAGAEAKAVAGASVRETRTRTNTNPYGTKPMLRVEVGARALRVGYKRAPRSGGARECGSIFAKEHSSILDALTLTL